MQVELLSNEIDIKKYLKNLNVDSGGISIMGAKLLITLFYLEIYMLVAQIF